MSARAGRLRADWPFAAAEQPYFYGWMIAVVSTLGFLMSIPGQTMGMAVFADAFIDAFGLSRTELSTAYLFGTMASALFLTRAGRWYDQLGARFMIVAASLVLAATLVGISLIGSAATALSGLTNLPTAGISFVLILIGFFGVRFSGQGVLTSASRNVLLVWFERRRGLVSGVRGVFVSLGFSIAPVVLALLIDTYGWRGALWFMAAVVGVGFAAFALVTVRDHPKICGLEPDGRNVADATQTSNKAAQTHFTLAEARRNPVFWMYALALSMHAMFGTAVTFHIAAIFEEAGRSRVEAFAYFVPQAVVSVVTNLGASALADRTRLKPYLVIMLGAFIAGACGLTQLDSEAGYWLLVVGFGAGGGLWGVLSNLVFVRQFGTLHLGEVSGLNTSITVFASAIGPVLFSLANDVFGSFRAAAFGCLGLLAILFVCAVLLRQPLDRAPQNTK